jgi:hypothetical protein
MKTNYYITEFNSLFLSPCARFNDLPRSCKHEDISIPKESLMVTQTIIKPVVWCNFVFSLSAENPAYEEAILASSLDYGFDFDEELLGRELLAPLPAGFEGEPVHNVDAEEFESLHRWFCS